MLSSGSCISWNKRQVHCWSTLDNTRFWQKLNWPKFRKKFEIIGNTFLCTSNKTTTKQQKSAMLSTLQLLENSIYIELFWTLKSKKNELRQKNLVKDTAKHGGGHTILSFEDNSPYLIGQPTCDLKTVSKNSETKKKQEKREKRLFLRYIPTNIIATPGGPQKKLPFWSSCTFCFLRLLESLKVQLLMWTLKDFKPVIKWFY